MSRVHVSIALKVMYNNKHVFFRNGIGTLKYNISPWGLKSQQRDREGHRYNTYTVDRGFRLLT